MGTLIQFPQPQPRPEDKAGRAVPLNHAEKVLGFRDRRVLADGSTWWIHAHGEAHVRSCECEHRSGRHLRIDLWPSGGRIELEYMGLLGGFIAGLLIGMEPTG